jgi:hypothetical protein
MAWGFADLGKELAVLGISPLHRRTGAPIPVHTSRSVCPRHHDNGRAVFLAAVFYTNADGIRDDDKYA